MTSDRTFAAVVALCVVLAAALVVGLGDASESRGLDLVPAPDRPAAAVASAAAAPAISYPAGRRALARLRAESSAVLDGDIASRLDELRGVPVVVNVWAAWCPSCRDEFPAFAEIAERYDGKVAFLGLDSDDDRDDAERFLAEFPVPYPSLFDPDADEARSIGAARSWPTTVFFDARGERAFVREGGYASARALDADVRTYALRR